MYLSRICIKIQKGGIFLHPGMFSCRLRDINIYTSHSTEKILKLQISQSQITHRFNRIELLSWRNRLSFRHNNKIYAANQKKISVIFDVKLILFFTQQLLVENVQMWRIAAANKKDAIGFFFKILVIFLGVG